MFPREKLIGHWYRSDNTEFESTSEMAQLNEDGTFSFTFYLYNLDGQILDEVTEYGDWGLVGDIHFTITKEDVANNKRYMADMLDPENYHAYRVLELNEQAFIYEHVVSKEKYKLFKLLGDDKQY
jgi:hypothetical protein